MARVSSRPGARHRKKKTAAKTAAVPPRARALEFKLKDIEGQERDLSEFAGKVILMVNTASKCGYTPQYEALQKLYQQHEARGFVILAFPSNNFGEQEPGSNEDIKKFCSEKYQVSFPLFAKIDVKGKDICPLYKYLTGTNVGHRFGGDVKWNFTKFLINRKGQIVGRFDSKEDPLNGKKISAAIKKALDEPRPGEAKEAAKPKSNPKSPASRGDVGAALEQ